MNLIRLSTFHDPFVAAMAVIIMGGLLVATGLI